MNNLLWGNYPLGMEGNSVMHLLSNTDLATYMGQQVLLLSI